MFVSGNLQLPGEVHLLKFIQVVFGLLCKILFEHGVGFWVAFLLVECCSDFVDVNGGLSWTLLWCIF